MRKQKSVFSTVAWAAVATMVWAGSAHAQSSDLADYVIFALESVRLKNPQSTGSIGVNLPGGKLSLGKDSFFGDGTEVVSDSARIGAGSSIYDFFANTLSGRFDPAIVRGSGPHSFTPPIVPVLPPVADFLCGGPAVTVKKGEGALLPPGVYGNVVFRNDSTVTLAGIYTMCRFKIGKGVLVVAASPTVINVVGSALISDGSLISPPPGGSRLKINLAGGSFRFGKHTLVRALIDARFAKVGLGNGDFEGRLIARQVRSDFGLRLVLPTCGDGFVDDAEECDDGNKLDSDGCRNNCTETAPTPTQTPQPTPTPTATATPTPTPSPTPAPVCQIEVKKTAAPQELTPPAGNACLGKVKSMALRYDGKGCAANANQQGTKASCSGDAGFANPVRIVARDKNNQVLLDVAGVGLGDSVAVAAGSAGILSSETRVYIMDGSSAVLEYDLVHTSCSRPLDPGDRFGSLEVIALDSTLGGMQSLSDNVTYTYEATNTGNASLFGVSVIDDKLGEIPGSPIAQIGPGAKAILQASAFITETTENQVLVSGHLLGGQSCHGSASALVTVTNLPESCAEGKKVASITLRYTGQGCSASDNDQGDKASCTCASTEEEDGNDNSSAPPCDGAHLASPVWIVGRSGSSTVLDASPVAIGDEVTADAAAGGKPTLKGDLRIDVIFRGSTMEEDVIHVSCSQPLAVGDRFGSFEVTDLVLVDKR